MLNIILRRQSLPWHSISWKEFECVTFLDDNILEIAREWNRQLNIPYLKFRAELKEIASDCLGAVKDADLLEANSADLITQLPRESIMVGVDDDDWLAPGIFRKLRRFQSPETLMFIWKAGVWDWRFKSSPVISSKTNVMTVNTGLVGLRGSSICRYAEEIAQRPNHEMLLDSWGVELIKRRIEGSLAITKVPDGLSVTVKSPGSARRLKDLHPGLNRLRILDQADEIPRALSWSVRHIERCRELAKRTFT